jgi:diguanylate cyclase (GGDEF)-like protein
MLTSVLAIGVIALLCGFLYLYRQQRNARQDLIAGLPSRAFFERYLQNCVARGTRNPAYQFGVLLIDMQGYDELRRTIGRARAEQILADFAQRVYSCIRPNDLFARLDGDSLAILLDDVRGTVDVPRVAIRVHGFLEDLITSAAVGVAVEARIGVTISHSSLPLNAAALMSQATAALERAIDTDRPYALFDEELEASTLRDLQVESELSDAIAKGQFSLGFQPLVDSQSHELCGFSALVRWAHPKRGLLQARDFIEIAENSGQILPIGDWVLGEAVRALDALITAAGRPIVLTVHVGATEAERGDVGDRLARALSFKPALAQGLRIELPPEVLATPTGPTTVLVDRLVALGVGVHVDYAGGGVPLWKAIRMNVQGLRLNVGALTSADVDALHRVITACRPIAPEIVVEGIETDEVDQLTRSIDPPVWAQGYGIGWPVSFQDALIIAESGIPPRVGAR